MRVSFMLPVVAALTVAALAPSSATAEIGGMHQYSACSCQFGYPGRACVPAVACASEGGRCTKSCAPETTSSEAQ
jgi:hypothetical protein